MQNIGMWGKYSGVKADEKNAGVNEAVEWLCRNKGKSMKTKALFLFILLHRYIELKTKKNISKNSIYFQIDDLLLMK